MTPWSGQRDTSGRWTYYTPTMVNGTAGSGATFNGRFTRIGDTVHFWAYVVLGSTGRAINSGVGLTLPVAAQISSAYAADIDAKYVDVGTSAYQATGVLITGYVGTYAINTLGAAWATSATVPFTWASGDVIAVSGTYAAA